MCALGRLSAISLSTFSHGVPNPVIPLKNPLSWTSRSVILSCGVRIGIAESRHGDEPSSGMSQARQLRDGEAAKRLEPRVYATSEREGSCGMPLMICVSYSESAMRSSIESDGRRIEAVWCAFRRGMTRWVRLPYGGENAVGRWPQ